MEPTLQLGTASTCLGCKQITQYPNGFRKGVCGLCFPRSLDDKTCDITLNDIVKMLFTREGSFLRCDQRIINYLRKALEIYNFPKLSKSIPKGYQLNIENEKYSDYNSAGELIGETWDARIMILEPNACDPINDIPIATFNVDRNFNIL
tara:strand:- start:17037 stop:17483 length:447 start_codon:yes stop_codon:yes gene_type:complete